ncbi:hypothetical protein [Pedobacter sp. UYP1]|uniref:hypothetical protein n=1 Tax=Pedobacter sp. UYP1 TaxID=1756396 RepID=UPI00339AF55F
MKFEDYYWHDSEIRNITIDRTNPGNKDTIVLEVDWTNKGLGQLVFENVYWASLNMNFGIVAVECIDFAYVADQNDIALNNIYSKWNGLINDVKLYCYVIKTLSTESEIKIIASDFKVIYL